MAPSRLLFFLLASFSLPIFARFGFQRFYRNATLKIAVIVRTSDCLHAGTDSDVSASPGFTDNYGNLVWWHEMRMIKGNKGENLEKATAQEMINTVPQEQVNEIEQACTMHSRGDPFEYDKCFFPNLVIFKMYTWFGNIDGDWKPGTTTFEMLWKDLNGSAPQNLTSHITNYGCNHKWVQKNNAYAYLCRNSAYEQYIELPVEGAPVVGEKVNACA
ncbi:hypothetical protein L596_025514 [Steinernema carpocapsae]|uniref:C-type lectin domain-containing protein n=1 Tax=Steinernema carpocapsae TaxID=34508 RepID=A0A4U5M7Y9_STECR|nr:hypothetical protein L596_025514 [Steinernema carpocapsae]